MEWSKISGDIIEKLTLAAATAAGKFGLSSIRKKLQKPPPPGQPQRKLLIIGHGGTGKTTLGAILAGGFKAVESDYDESIAIEELPHGKRPEVSVVVAPGQKIRREAIWRPLEERVEAGEFRGVVFVSAYGYCTLGHVDRKKVTPFEKKRSEFLRGYTQQSRADELKAVAHVLPSFAKAPGKIWLLSAVTKQDLWWPQRDAVEQHYKKGVYARKVAQLLRRCDAERVRHEVAFGSLIIKNFTTGRGELLQENRAGYDSVMQAESLERLLSIIDSLLDWDTAS